ncbi:Retrovirus-related Pol polyprotein from transposon RE1, partial [Linum perenne]
FGRPIKSFRADWGGEYQGLSSYLAQHGILEQTSCPHTPEQNGCAERKHRHITETGRTLLHHAAVPLEYWTYAFQTAAYLINRYPNPYHVLRVQKTSLISSQGPHYPYHSHLSSWAHRPICHHKPLPPLPP